MKRGPRAGEWGGRKFWFWPHALRHDGCVFGYSWLGFIWYPRWSELDESMAAMEREEAGAAQEGKGHGEVSR